MILSGSTLYGTTEHGGTNGYGVVFKVNTNGTGFVNLHNFTNGTDGSVPHTLVISGSTLYGTSLGLSGNGTVFALSTNGTGFTALHSFIATNFTFPQGGPAAGPGIPTLTALPQRIDFIGQYPVWHGGGGGTNGTGTVFTINTNGTGFTILHNFAASSTNSSGATPTVTDSTVEFGGLVLSSKPCMERHIMAAVRAMARCSPSTPMARVLQPCIVFRQQMLNGNNSDGANPYASLTLSSNTLYGTAKAGGTNGAGTVFSIYLGLVVTTTSLPNGTNGVAYNQTLTATGGQKPYTWTNISGTLPPGLTLATNGVISGTPTVAGTSNFTVR